MYFISIPSSGKHINLLWPSDVKWWHKPVSTWAQVMARCLTAPSHYLNQCWHIISKVHWHSSEPISREILQPSITKINWKVTYLKFHLNLSGVNELNPPILATIAVNYFIGGKFRLMFEAFGMEYTLTHWGRDKMAAISQTAISNAFR